MKREIKWVDIVFENCEVSRLKPKQIYSLVVDKITYSRLINCYQYEDGEVCDYINCEEMELIINLSGLKNKDLMTEGKALEQRLEEFRDITHIHIYYKDKTDEYITVPWKGERDTNELQTHTDLGYGLKIAIKSNLIPPTNEK